MRDINVCDTNLLSKAFVEERPGLAPSHAALISTRDYKSAITCLSINERRAFL